MVGAANPLRMGWRARLLLVLMALVGIWAPVAAMGASSASPDFEQRFVDLTGGERTGSALAGYAVEGDLVEVARRHAERMASENRLYHNPALADDVSGWQAVGENVGRGPSVDEIHRAFMNSPSHRDNVMSSEFTQVGVGVHVTDAGDIWVAEVFRRPQAAAPAPTPVAAPVAAPAPASARREVPVRVPERASRSAEAPVVVPVAAPEPGPAPVVVDPTPALVAELSALQVWPGTVAAVIAAAPEPAVGDVTLPIRLAATLLVLVVGAQTLYVRKYVVGGLVIRNEDNVLKGVQLAMANS